MTLQAGILSVEAGLQVSEGLIDVRLKPGSHLLNQLRSRVETTVISS
jgi:hypothetical protein